MVMAQSLFIALKQQYPEAKIDVLAPAWSRALLDRMPEVNQAIEMPLGHGNFGFKERKSLGRQLRNTQYTQSIILPNSWKSALTPWFANIPIRTGWKGEARYFLLNDLRKLDKNTLPLMVQRFVALAYNRNHKRPLKSNDCPTPKLIANNHNKVKLIKQLKLNTNKKILVICPGAEFGPAKQWPADYYGQVASYAITHNWQVWIMGSQADKDIAEEVLGSINTKNHIDDVKNLCGKTRLEDAIDLMDLGDHIVSNDSGLMHIASALNKPLTALYGATSPKFTPPLSKSAAIIATDVDCGPCFKRHCPEGHHKCMNELLPDKVINSIFN